MQKIREQVLIRRDNVYQDNEGEVRKRWNFEDAVSFFLFPSLLSNSTFAVSPSSFLFIHSRNKKLDNWSIQGLGHLNVMSFSSKNV